ncbi:MAG: hypothetical protein ABIR94_11585 [Rubrivivax sp.]
MLRALVAILLLANLAFLGLVRGWFEPVLSLSTRGDHEPQRLAAQINPQALRVLPLDAGSAPPAPASAAR